MTAFRDLVFPEAVEAASDLFGREAQVRRVQEALGRAGRLTVVLLGGRLVGKTSVLNVVAQWAEAEASYQVIRLAHAGSREELMAEIVHGIHERVGASRSTNRELTRQDALRNSTVARFVKLVHELAGRAPHSRFLLCVDEFDSLLQGCPDGTARQLLDLVTYLTEQARLPTRFLFTMSRVPEVIARSYGSPFLNQATIVELGPWPEGQTRQFADWLLGGRLRMDPTGHAALFAATGGHPYVTKAVLQELLEAEPATADPVAAAAAYAAAVDAAAVDAAVAAAVRSREVDIALSNIASVYLPDGAVPVLDRAATSPTGLTHASIRDLPAPDTILDTLTEAGLLTREHRHYRLRLGMWRQWRRLPHPPDSRPGPLARLIGLIRLVRRSRPIRWPAPGNRLRAGLAATLLLLLGLAYGPQLLFSDQRQTIRPCDGTASGLRVTASYPAYLSAGDQHQLQIQVANTGTGAAPVTGTLVVNFPEGGPGPVTIHGDNGASFEQLRPGQQQTLQVSFTHRQPGRPLPRTRPAVPAQLVVQTAAASCASHSWTMPVAPLPYLRQLQRGAVTLVAVLAIPLVIDLLIHRISSHRTGSRTRTTGTGQG